MTRDQELELLAKARQDLHAFNQLYDHYLPKIFSYCWNRLGSRELCEDVTSEVFVVAVEKLPGLKLAENATFGSFLYSIAHNKIVDYYRRHSRDFSHKLDLNNLLSEEGQQEAESRILKQQLQLMVIAVLSGLNERYQAVITYRFYSELTPEETAAAMNVKAANVNVVLHRALQAFKKQWQKTYPGTEIFNLT
jgi:RNA polymerase sigma-70 factor (ECF subfamily)